MAQNAAKMKKRRRARLLENILPWLNPLIWLFLPIHWISEYPDRYWLKANRCGDFEGIFLSDDSDEHQKALFVYSTEKALRILKRHAPRQYGYIQRYVRQINNKPMLHGDLASWDEDNRVCHIDFSQWIERLQDYQAESYAWHLGRYASILVHEATHAKLHRLHFPYSRRFWRKIETICFREERRCFRKFVRDTDTPEWHAWIRNVDLSDYEARYRLTAWQRLKSIRQQHAERR